MNNTFFIAYNDVRQQLRQWSTLAWIFVMPPIFFYFIGTAMSGGIASNMGGAPEPLLVIAENPGYLKEQIGLRLAENQFAPTWVESPETDDAPAGRILTLPPNLSERTGGGDTLTLAYETDASALTRDYETIRLQRALYTVLADLVVADASGEGGASAAAVAALNEAPRTLTLDIASAGRREGIPLGFAQSVPGIMVMFTMIVLLTSGASLLAIERHQGLLRRLASAPIGRGEVVLGKWIGRMALALVQVAVALLIGTLVFAMDWGPDLAMVILVLALWAAFCASAGLLLGSIVATEAQATGIGVLVASLLAALGGCWWPIEITPPWMQGLQKFLPTGWTMDALHQLVNFQSGAASVLPNAIALAFAALVVGIVATNRFRYQ